MKKILILPGDGIGTEIIVQAQKIIDYIAQFESISTEQALIGGIAYDQEGSPLPQSTIDKAKQADAILLGAVGGPKWESLDYSVRPERGLLGIRKELNLFANLRPAILYSQLAHASPLKYEFIENLDILIVRELTGGIYFGEPRGVSIDENGEKYAFNTYIYKESEIRRIAKVAFDMAMKRNKKLTSVDKANVLEVTEFWRDILSDEAKNYPEVELNHLYVDNAAMQLCYRPKQFDVIVTGNLFGDILSDEAAMLTGSIGMLPSASLNDNKQGLYEPVHGSAPDISGQNLANPIATVLSLAMMLKYSLNLPQWSINIEKAVQQVLDTDLRTKDIEQKNCQTIGTEQMGDAILAQLKSINL